MAILTDLAEAWRPWAWGATWQLALLVALIAGLLLGARKMPPRLRYALWLLVTIKVFLPPSLGLVWGIGTWGIEPVRHRAEAWVGSAANVGARSEQGRGETRLGQMDRMDKMDGMDSASAPAKRDEGAAVAGPATSTPSIPSMPSIAPISSSSPADAGAPAPGGPGTLPTHLRNWEIRHIAHAPFAVWLLGVAGFTGFVLTRYARFSRRLRDGEEVTEGPLRIELERLAARLGQADPPELLLSAAVSSPLLCGLFRPRIVLPANLPETLSADDLSNVLLHELIHWRRRDVAVGWLQLAGQALFWFHPLVWFANSRARHERECACDEAALAIGRCAPKAYGESLLKVLLASEGRSAAEFGFLGIFERGTRIQNRLEAIMKNSVRSRRGNLLGWIGLAVFALVCLPMFPAAKATGQGPAGTTAMKPDAKTAPDAIPTATGIVEGALRCDKNTPLGLSVGDGPAPSFTAKRIRFGKRGNVVIGTLLYSRLSYPAAKWQVSVQAMADDGTVIVRDEKQCGNSGGISSWARIEPGKMEFSLADVGKIPADAKFRLTVECFPETSASPGAQSVAATSSRTASAVADAKSASGPKAAATESDEGTVKYDVDIPMRLSAGDPPLTAKTIRFEKHGASVVGLLDFAYVSGPKVKWQIVAEVLGSDGATVVWDDVECENSGVVAGVGVWTPGQAGFRLGNANEIPADAKFRVTVECFPEAAGKAAGAPVAPTVSSATSTSSTRSAASTSSTSSKIAATLSYVHDTAEGKRSLGASGHAVEFTRPDKAHFVEAVRIYASRYGMPEPPQEDFHVYLLNEKKEVLADLKVPYSMVERGDMKWYELRTPSIEVPDRFLVALAFNPAQTKGIYLGLDEAAEGGHSFTGLPGEGYEKWGGKPGEKGDWMVRVDLAESPSGDKSVQRLADWKAPVTTDPFAGCIEAKYDAGESDDKQSYGGRGPAIQVRPADFGLVSSVATGGSGGGGAAVGVPAPVANPRLIGFRLYAGRYGTDYDPAQTQLKVAILDSANQVRWQGAFPYALFAYKSKWVDLVLKEPPAVRDLAGGDGVLTIAFDPEAQQTKGIYFHYNRNPQASHSFAGTVARGFQPVADREWIVRAVFESVKPGEAPTARTANEVTPTQPAMQSAAQSATEAKRAWGPEQATGAPDTTRSGDIETAWASLEPDGGAEWLELDYAPSFRANQVRIAETFNPGAVTALVLKDDQGTTITVVQVTDTTAQAPAFLEVPFALTQRPVKSVRVVLDTRKVPGWNEIDAVELVGPEGRGWAAAARASSTFAERTATGAGREPVFQVQFGSGGPGNAVRPWNGTAADPSKRAWGPEQATGAPDTTAAGDIETAWASLEQDLGAEWLELDYAPALRANQVRIAETFNPGAVTALVLKDDQDTTIGVVQVSDTTTQAPAFLEVPFALTQRPVKSVRVVLDTRKVPGWNEIDAVELVGPDGRGWAVAARASSTYAERASRAAAAGPATALPAGTPPRIVATIPAVGAVDVDPATAEITVTFDRDMAGGFSWTGGGEYYPKFQEGAKPSWRDKRTCVLSVNLEAGHFYRVGINSTSFGNFRSTEGVSAAPSAIYFATQGASDDVKALAQPPHVVKMEPANGAAGVDPKTTELRVTFNVPMGGGNSWCGGGPSFPVIPEGKRASWSEDHKTAILPVALQPDKTYSLSLNAPSFKNFTNAAGVALDPVPYSFTTGK